MTQRLGEQIETTVDLSKLKIKDFKLKGDENGWFDFETPIRKDKIKFRYLTRKQEKQLRKITELEGYGTKASLLESEADTLASALVGDTILTEAQKKTIDAAVNTISEWASKLKEENDSSYNKLITNNLQMQIMSVNGDTDKKRIREYIMNMPARDALMLRRYISDNAPRS